MAFIYQSAINQSLILMLILTRLCLFSVYQLMRPVDLDTTVQSDDSTQKQKRTETQSVFILWRAHANQPLVPFQRQKLDISIPAMRYE